MNGGKMSVEDNKRPTGNDGFATVVSWAVIIVGVLVVLGAGGCILVSMPTDGGLALLLGGPPFLFGLGAVYVAWQLLQRLKG